MCVCVCVCVCVCLLSDFSVKEFQQRKAAVTNVQVSVTPTAVVPKQQADELDELDSVISQMEGLGSVPVTTAASIPVTPTQGRQLTRDDKKETLGDLLEEFGIDTGKKLSQQGKSDSGAELQGIPSSMDDYFDELESMVDTGVTGLDQTSRPTSPLKPAPPVSPRRKPPVSPGRKPPSRPTSPKSRAAAEAGVRALLNPSAKPKGRSVSPRGPERPPPASPATAVSEPAQDDIDEPEIPVPEACKDPTSPNFDTVAYKNYMKQKYEREQRINAKLLRKKQG